MDTGSAKDKITKLLSTRHRLGCGYGAGVDAAERVGIHRPVGGQVQRAIGQG